MKLNDINPGDALIVDDGFTCMEPGDQKVAQMNQSGELFVDCSDGRHFLDGQVGDDGHLVGIKSAAT